MAQELDLDELRATYDHPADKSVIELIDRLEQAVENLESALEANKRWAHRSSRERSELFKAEQAVARVREAIKGAPTYDPTRGFAGPPDDYPDIIDFIGNGEWSVAERVRKALDGDGRE